MCRCRFEAAETIRAKLFPEATSAFFDFEMLSGKTHSTLYVTIPGQKKQKEVKVLHTYCPHCGEKYPERPDA